MLTRNLTNGVAILKPWMHTMYFDQSIWFLATVLMLAGWLCKN